ncbi:MAG: glycine cleavage system aminomethyltransferase GcvT [Anaerolineae bacterium]
MADAPEVVTLKRTPLYDTHRRLGGKMVEFAGWDMPVQYPTGILEEHRAVRQAAGLFDVSHMGEIEISGPRATDFLKHVVSNDPSQLIEGECQYNIMCYPSGGAVDDLIVYRLGENDYLAVVNASNAQKDFAWMQAEAASSPEFLRVVTVKNRSDEYGLIALQGPRAVDILQPLTDVNVAAMGYYHFAKGQVAGVDALVSRTGYTGEDGFEIMTAAADTTAVWDALMQAGEGQGLKPAGLGARDTLRLEAAMPLYGHELDIDIGPIEAGLNRFVNFDKGDFVGREPLAAAKANGPATKLIGFEMVGRGIPRGGYEVAKDGEVIGVVTSGTQSPTLAKAIGMAYVKPAFATVGADIDIIIRGQPVAARIVKRPFYRRPKG